MAKFSVEIPDEDVPAIEEAFCTLYYYDPASGMSPTEFTMFQIVKIIKQTEEGYRVNKAVLEAQRAAQTAATPSVTVSVEPSTP